uniref:Response regulatory domain-containing protein n=1 Tax=Candidatus Kentrum sp. DK TaxID=2126562 RepID=A0A450S3C0_9GAMM|nr:MAG: hypothetical protein BECKDK2373C_GA0170839_101414 [Candidatus Kentron sp. DK]
MKTINILIVDDNPITADFLRKRLEKLNERFHDESGISIRPFYCRPSIIDPLEAGKSVNGCMTGSFTGIFEVERKIPSVVSKSAASPLFSLCFRPIHFSLPVVWLRLL